MPAFSGLSVLALDAEWGELLPEREALQLTPNIEVVVVTSVALNVAAILGDANTVHQVIVPTPSVALS